MTMVLRGAPGPTITLQQEGSRIRIVNPTGEDDGEAHIVDLDAKTHVIVYDDAKAYFDFSKALATARALVTKADRAKLEPMRRKPAPSYRTLNQTRKVNGFSCDMYERVVARRIDAEICFALWGDAIGQKEDFAWLEAFMERSAADVSGRKKWAGAAHSTDRAPGLPIWTSSFEEDGSREVMEVVQISRDPLPAAMFQIPSDYKEFPRPLSVSERPRNAAQVPVLGAPSVEKRPTVRISGGIMILLIIVLVIGLMIHSVILHLAAYMVIDNARFMQAVVASLIIWLVEIVAELFGLPPILRFAVTLLASFAGLKISYGASTGRTLALFFVCALIAALITFAGAAILPGRS